MRIHVAVFVALAAATDVQRQPPLGGPASGPTTSRSCPAPTVLRWLSLGHPTLAANLLWLRAVQYIGEPGADERGWDKLYPVVDA